MMDDREIRIALQALRGVPVPPLPALRHRAPRVLGALSAAGVMIAFLAALLWPAPLPTPAGSIDLSQRIASVTQRVDRLDDAELRALLTRELELLRRELELAGE
jgi:hypothetical protein